MSLFMRLFLHLLFQIQPTHTAYQIDEIIDDRIVSTRDSDYHRFLTIKTTWFWEHLN